MKKHYRIAFSDQSLIAEVTHPKLAEILEEIPGFAAIIESSKNITQQIEPRITVDAPEFAQRLIAGESPTGLAIEYGQARAEQEAYRTALDHIIETARGLHDNRVQQFLSTHATDVAAGIARRYQQAVDSVRLLIDDLEHVHAAEDLADHPEAAPAWAQFIGNARRVDEWRQLWRHYFKPAHGGYYPDLELVKNLPEVAPEIWKHKNPMTPMWGDTATMLRHLAAHHAVMWAPTPAELSIARAELIERAARR